MIDNPEYLAFRRGIIYEGNFQQLWALYPIPEISFVQCDFIDIKPAANRFIFREDSFDSIARIRRGRIYYYYERADIGSNWYRRSISNGLYGPIIGLHHDDEKFDYDAAAKIAEPRQIKDTIGAEIDIGSHGYASKWKIIEAERNVHGHIVFTVKSISFFGLIPELASDSIKTKDGVELLGSDKTEIVNSINGVIDTLSIQQPTVVADSARECCKVILTKWYGQECYGKDLGDVAKMLGKNHLILCSAANLISRFHSNGKSAERENKELRGINIIGPSMDDAEICIYLLGLIIRVIGWARSTRYLSSTTN
jgi:hypothetical protein